MRSAAERSRRRLEKELKNITKNPLPGISVGLKADNLYEWEAKIQGPSYEGSKFVLDISFPENYPMKPPVVTFRTKIDECNVNSGRKLSSDALGRNWSAVHTVKKILLSILSSTVSFNTSRSQRIDVEISKRRLETELVQIANEPLPGISVGLKDGNLYKWEATIQGPPGTPYEGGKFVLDISFPEDYPFKPPVITFRTPIYHCNVNSDGKLSLNILYASKWVASITVDKVLLCILSLLNDCDSQYPFVPEIAAQYINNREEHDQVCKDWTKKYAS